MGEATLTLADVERAIAIRDPQLGGLLVRYVAQPDMVPGHSELLGSSGDDELWGAADGEAAADAEDAEIDVPAGAFTIDRLRGSLTGNDWANKNPTEKKLTRRDAFASAEASAFAPPRLRLGAILIGLYEQGDPEGRAALVHVFTHGMLRWGVWKAAKTIYKLAELRHDAEMFGALAYRFDAMSTLPYINIEIGLGTIIYLRRRAWRYLRLLGRASPDAYPVYAVEVLRHYPASHGAHAQSWVAAHIWAHGQLRYARNSASFQPPTQNTAMTLRAYPDAWKASPAPLLRLLEAAENDLVCDFAIRSLRADHALALRAVEPAWLARLGRRSVAAIHAFVVSLLRESPELHQSKLRELGLHDVVVGFLKSPSADARTYALEYVAAHAPDLAIELLVELIGGPAEVSNFAAARLESLSPQQLGVGVLLQLLGRSATPWATTKLASFPPSAIDAEAFIATAARGADAYNSLINFYNTARAAIPSAHYTALLDDPRFANSNWQYRTIIQGAFTELGKRTARDIGIDWIKKSFEDRNRTGVVAQWLDAGMLSGADLDVEWLKTLVAKPRLRSTALKLLGDRRRVSPARVGLSWLLELARSSESDLAQFAQRMLLESFEPQDFADGDRAAGVLTLWGLAAGKKQPETVRAFAQTYLKAHHPELGTRLAEAKALGITPRLSSEAYPLATLKPLFEDDRVDVRRFALAIAGEELIRWNDRGLVYELAASKHAETRGFGGAKLLGVLDEAAQSTKLPAAWIDGAQLFRLAESAHKPAREVALTLIRRLYESIGGAEKLAWLMDSTERDVRLFAVRLFWDRHRPKPWPAGYMPRKNVGAAIGTERFTDLPALRQFVRVVLFGLPPGRVGRSDGPREGDSKPERALPASVAKRRLIEALRDIALEDVDLAAAIAPVLREFAESTAKGEWQASVQALTALRARHGSQTLGDNP